MGSWNYSCMASNQLISAQSRCRLVFLAQQVGYTPLEVLGRDGQPVKVSGVSKYGHGADAYWEPLSGFLEATYLDVGRFALAFTPGSRQMLLHFLRSIDQCAMTTPAGDHRADPGFVFQLFLAQSCPKLRVLLHHRNFHGFDFNLDSLDHEFGLALDYVLAAAMKYRLFYACPISRQVRAVTIGVMHEEAYQGLVQFTTSFSDIWTESFAPADFFAQVFERVGEDLPRHDKSYAALSGLEPSGAAGDAVRLHFIGTVIFDAMSVTAHLDSSQLRMLRGWFASPACAQAYIDDVQTKQSSLKDLLLPVLHDVYALVAMREMNLVFSPAVSLVIYDGSEPSRRYAAFVSKVSGRCLRAADEVAFGPFRPYRARFTSVDLLQQVIAGASSWDVRANVLEENMPFVRFEVTVDDIQDVRRMLTDLGDSLAASTVQPG